MNSNILQNKDKASECYCFTFLDLLSHIYILTAASAFSLLEMQFGLKYVKITLPSGECSLQWENSVLLKSSPGPLPLSIFSVPSSTMFPEP